MLGKFFGVLALVALIALASAGTSQAAMVAGHARSVTASAAAVHKAFVHHYPPSAALLREACVHHYPPSSASTTPQMGG